MLKGNGTRIIQDEFDFGIELPIRLIGDILLTDKIVFTIKEDLSKPSIIEKNYETKLIQLDNKIIFNLSFTEDESKLLTRGDYIYIIQQFRNNKLRNTIIKDGKFIVE